jgi:hypothetical protein
MKGQKTTKHEGFFGMGKLKLKPKLKLLTSTRGGTLANGWKSGRVEGWKGGRVN